MGTLDDHTTSQKIEKFNGIKRDWTLWSEMFLARMEIKGLADVILMKLEDVRKD